MTDSSSNDLLMIKSDELSQHLEARYIETLDSIKKLELELAVGETVSDGHLQHISYGTAGFRGKAKNIVHLFYKVGLIAGLRYIYTRGANVGIMITASHNPVEDNGIKLIDANGQMLDSKWEPIVEQFCNLNNSVMFQHLRTLMHDVLGMQEINGDIASTGGCVMIGYDTRPTSESLVKLVKIGLDAWRPYLSYRDYGQLTTPALHYLVAESSLRDKKQLELTDYYDKLISGFVASFSQTKVNGLYDASKLIIDNSNGVGSNTMKYLCNNREFKKYLPVKLINYVDSDEEHGGGGVLNDGCGADFVKTRQMPPTNADELGMRYASLDGDADRVVYFYLEENKNEISGEKTNRLCLLDGDKILALYANYLIDVLRSYKLVDLLTLGIVQTAYANGASTDYLKQCLGVQVDCVDTGVKHLHKKALDYDLGVYFEANGHGTIWVSEKAKTLIRDNKILELQQLLAVLNNYTGDAISDVLIVELILRYYDWDLKKWNQLYVERPNCLAKVEIEDRTCVQTTNAGRTCIKPDGLQQSIDQLVKEYGIGARCFVRASGTENVVRIYAECQKQEMVQELAQIVGQKVIEMCN